MDQLASEKWHLSVQHKHEPLMFCQSLEAHTKALPWVAEFLVSGIALCESWAEQLPQRVPGSVTKVHLSKETTTKNLACNKNPGESLYEICSVQNSPASPDRQCHCNLQLAFHRLP